MLPSIKQVINYLEIYFSCEIIYKRDCSSLFLEEIECSNAYNMKNDQEVHPKENS